LGQFTTLALGAITTTLRALNASVTRLGAPVKCSHRCEKVAVKPVEHYLPSPERVESPGETAQTLNV